MIEGVYVAAVTPFRDDFSIDVDAYRAHVEWLAERGVVLGPHEKPTPEPGRFRVFHDGRDGDRTAGFDVGGDVTEFRKRLR